MDDEEFVDRMKEKIETTAEMSIELVIDSEDKRRLEVDLSPTMPKVIFGSDALIYSGLARMFSQYAILCLKERRMVEQQEFLLFMRRN